MRRLLDFYALAAPRALGVEGRARRAAEATRHHPRRRDHLVPGDRLAAAAHGHRSPARRRGRGHPDRAVQRARPAGRPRPRRARVADPRRGPGARPPGRRRSWSSLSWRPASTSTASSTALIGSFIYAIINTILTSLLGIDSGGSYYGPLIQRLMVKRSPGHSDKPGLVIIQIDGLAHPILAGRMRAGSVNTMAGLVRDGTPQAVALGGDPAVDDVGQPGRHPPRQQRRDPGVPLVRARPRAPHGLEQPRRCDADRLAHLERRGPALEQRREHLQPLDRRRDAVLPDDRGDQGRGRRDRRQQGVPVVLLQPDRLPALVHAVPRRVLQGAIPGAADPAVRHPTPDAPWA